MHVTSPSTVMTAVTPTEWQKTEWQHWFSAWMPRKTHKTHPKRERALRLTVQIALTQNLRYIFTDCWKLQKKEANRSLQFTETVELQTKKHVLQLSFCVKMLDFGVKSYPIYCIVIYCVDNSSIKYLPSYILHNWVFLNKHWQKLYKF